MTNFDKDLKAARDKGQAAIEAARALVAEYNGKEMPADVEEKFQKMSKDAADACEEVQRLEAQRKSRADLDKAEQFMREADRSVQHRDGGGSAHVSDERMASLRRDAFHAYLRHDIAGVREFCSTLKAEEAHALISANDASMGYLVPADFQAKVIERRAGVAVIRSAAMVVPTSRDTVEVPRIAAATSNATMYASGFGGQWTNDETNGTADGSAPSSQNQPTAELLSIKVHNWVPKPVIVSPDTLDDAALPIEPILSRVIGTTQALDEDYEFINGAGVRGPKGILSHSGITQVTSGSSGAVTYNGLVDLIYGLPAQYAADPSCRLLMRRATFGSILKLVGTSNDHPIFPVNAAPNTLFTVPMMFSDFMPAVAANAYAVVYGAFSEYWIADRLQLRIQKLVERYSPNVGLQPRARVGGDVAVPEAFRILKLA